MPRQPLAFASIAVPSLPNKPRPVGLTSILDKGLGPGAVLDLTRIAGDWIDVAKLGWGTSRLAPTDALLEKIDHYRAVDVAVSTGGTFLEVAVAQGRVDAFLSEARHLGFAIVEISNGVHPMSVEEKLELIRRVQDTGFRAWSEVGKKDPEEDARISVDARLEMIERELAAGAERVILEGRESGTVGIYDKQGRPAEELLHRIQERFPADRIVYEAPQKSQQLWLMREFGPLVNMANIPAEDAISVATLRLGLRGDTLADVHLSGVDVHLELGVNGALAAQKRGGVVVVIDALRASATIVTALASGMAAVRPVATPDECRGEVTAGERGGKKIAQAMHGNSPTELLRHDYRGKTLTLTTTNAIECILTARSPATTVLVGTTLNAAAVARHALALAKAAGAPITLLMAGRNNREAPEDELGAALILDEIGPAGRFRGSRPHASSAIETTFLASDSGRNLLSLGYAEDVQFCAQRDIYRVVPVLRGDRIVAEEL